jgi:PPK2 family polyphosphate:nucleotide phosphotransferase
VNHARFLVKPGTPVRLAELDPTFTAGFEGKSDIADKLRDDLARLAELQDVFYAARSRALVLVLQGMDAAGKDGAVKHVMTGLNPEGVDVFSFKEPSSVELEHDFLWRVGPALPARGRMSVFNRSYYEEVIVVRVHPELLAAQHLPAKPGGDELWAQRFEDINAFERHLVRGGTDILKCFLHLSRDEQRERLLARVDDRSKNWKLSPQDVVERGYWDAYQDAYEKALGATSTADAPWYVIPADHKWFARAAIAHILVAKLDALHLHYPRVDKAQRAALKAARVKLEAEGKT